ncbi:MAG: hypothetical protein JWR55_2295 [Aeromicrobium sp.]|jgi:hypothetical protein|nr:hypothetical protein [Aeromicrobium sp.]
MPKPFKKKTFRAKLESQLSDLAEQTDELRKQVVDRAPAVRDQIVGQTGELRKQVADRAPAVRDQIVAALPDKEQLLDLRDDLFDRLPENVQEKLPEKAKPQRKRLRKVAAIGVLTGAGAAAFAILKRRGASRNAYTPTTPPAPAPAAPKAPVTPASAPTAGDIADDAATGGATKP